MSDKPLVTIGRAEEVVFVTNDSRAVPARVDTGAKTSAVWATNIIEKDHTLHFVLFDTLSPFYTGKIMTTHDYGLKIVSTSTGHVQERYAVKLPIIIGDKRIHATFTLADRSLQVYPVLIGRNVLRGKFIVDVKRGKPLVLNERLRSQRLRQKLLRRKGK